MGTNQPIVEWESVDWSKSTKQIAEEVGVSRSSVWKWRKRLAPKTNAWRERPDWDSVELGSAPDTEIAEALGVCADAVRNQRKARGIPAFASHQGKEGYDYDSQPLGKVPDMVVAEALGCHPQAVMRARQRRGIARFRPESRYDFSCVDWTKSNAQIAKEVGCAESWVRVVRKRLGVESARDMQRKRKRQGGV